MHHFFGISQINRCGCYLKHYLFWVGQLAPALCLFSRNSRISRDDSLSSNVCWLPYIYQASRSIVTSRNALSGCFVMIRCSHCMQPCVTICIVANMPTNEITPGINIFRSEVGLRAIRWVGWAGNPCGFCATCVRSRRPLKKVP